MIIILVLALLDRLSKYWVLNYLNNDIVIFPGVNLTLGFNRGVCFGFFSYSDYVYWLLTGIICLVLIAFTIYTIREYRLGQSVFWESIVIVGGLSNLLDRFLYGGVVDFIDLYMGSYHWYTFNLADCYIVVGVLFILFGSLRDEYLGKS